MFVETGVSQRFCHLPGGHRKDQERAELLLTTDLLMEDPSSDPTWTVVIGVTKRC